MAFDERLAERAREALAERGGIGERRMFGGLAFMHDGHMFAGVVGERLMVRVGVAAAAEALEHPHTSPMDFTGRPLKGYVYVAPGGLETESDLRGWLDAGLDFVTTLPPKR